MAGKKKEFKVSHVPDFDFLTDGSVIHRETEMSPELAAVLKELNADYDKKSKDVVAVKEQQNRASKKQDKNIKKNLHKAFDDEYGKRSRVAEIIGKCKDKIGSTLKGVREVGLEALSAGKKAFNDTAYMEGSPSLRDALKMFANAANGRPVKEGVLVQQDFYRKTAEKRIDEMKGNGPKIKSTIDPKLL